jgi:hypothetical protein
MNLVIVHYNNLKILNNHLQITTRWVFEPQFWVPPPPCCATLHRPLHCCPKILCFFR